MFHCNYLVLFPKNRDFFHAPPAFDTTVKGTVILVKSLIQYMNMTDTAPWYSALCMCHVAKMAVFCYRIQTLLITIIISS